MDHTKKKKDASTQGERTINNIIMVYGKLVKLFRINILFNSEVLLWKGLLRKMKSIYKESVKTGKVEALQKGV